MQNLQAIKIWRANVNILMEGSECYIDVTRKKAMEKLENNIIGGFCYAPKSSFKNITPLKQHCVWRANKIIKVRKVLGNVYPLVICYPLLLGS